MSIESNLFQLLLEALNRCRSQGICSAFDPAEIVITATKDPRYGDFSTNIALIVAAREGKKPRLLSEAICSALPAASDLVERVEVAGAGFINFTICQQWYLRGLQKIITAGSSYGRQTVGEGKRVQVEFVSANPTGPLHIGHGRGAVYGDVLGNLLRALGYEVSKEYYVNDTGVQIQTLGRSVFLRFCELQGKSIDFPPDCYQGDYIRELAASLFRDQRQHISKLGEGEAIALCGEYAAASILAEIKRDLAATGVIHDKFFFEHELHAAGHVQRALDVLKSRGKTYEKDGAVWFRSTEYGDDKDRVLRKSDGSLTYFAADVAYHKYTFDRSFDRVIDIWGADHGGYVARMRAMVCALGFKEENFDAVLIQLVNLVKDGTLLSMSTRSGQYETLATVLEDVGSDVCRYFFLMRSHRAQLDFDLDLARSQSADNPVYYIQYAHARIASVFRRAAEEGIELDIDQIDLGALVLPEEAEISRVLTEYPQVLLVAATQLEPHRLAFYLLELAKHFQSYYSKGRASDRYRVLTGDKRVTAAKLYLLKCIQIVIQNGLGILGISAPELMTREGDLDA